MPAEDSEQDVGDSGEGKRKKRKQKKRSSFMQMADFNLGDCFERLFGGI